ncbi:DUF4254 domain-containing protein [Lacihabitans sp. LS3-19]|uniref:DUF4254 domain-containing protein n=1 Tax=Lacihabitans sp. LS3-19 TaxID=2487335 RepID=UPI0020CCC238|nr:DUF4254 domain-containing protein [Lacihabitans sp. LS3-19]MCP9767707.1 DUF4254 domain-containing protein [Lacihabitans sp. LS3-19]
MKASDINKIFRESIADYHLVDNVDAEMPQKYTESNFKKLLYLKNWIDTVQWHLEDIIRDPVNRPDFLVSIKKRIDESNQFRTDTVEQIDELLFENFRNISKGDNPRMNSETPAWLLDRMSILQLKIYHFKEQIERKDADENHLNTVRHKLMILEIQEKDLELCYDQLIEDLEEGRKYMKLYKQMKMYNDPNLNPVFYTKK